jgi:hypothetical protein
MKHITALVGMVLGLVSASLALASPGQVERLRCYSEGSHFERCPTPFTVSGVSLLDLGHPEACVLGQTWGYDSQSIWVNDGCRGTFDVIEGGGVTAVLPPAVDSGAYDRVCERQSESLLLPRGQSRWTRLQCKGPCQVVSYAVSASPAICGWTLGSDQATVSCRNPGASQKVEVSLDCAR